MNRIDKALHRLNAAVSRLEDMGPDRLQTPAEEEADTRTVQRLSAELATVRTNYESLQLTSQQASGRIDAAISRLRAALEG